MKMTVSQYLIKINNGTGMIIIIPMHSIRAVPRFNITTSDVTVREDEGPAVVCVTASNNIDTDRFTTGARATLVTGPKSGASNQATGIQNYMTCKCIHAPQLMFCNYLIGP